MEKLRNREVKYFVQGYRSVKRRKQNLNPGILAVDYMLLTTILDSLILGA